MTNIKQTSQAIDRTTPSSLFLSNKPTGNDLKCKGRRDILRLRKLNLKERD